ncbi:DUF5011 domain-containing protein [Aquimarina sp. MMG015]|uniref:immunoglobulin-like domain-containing protein n=1 Tax=Aquimarina sp. MMG015 TaxID=2822689 RepID=UPI001B39DFCE|nr:immunoglobulin-like domain-containing protein [Aquimarina sp. MMG015]MBQ4805142.1 DUF5011 domain-containing protein [Aquimarina sp. MMG015]
MKRKLPFVFLLFANFIVFAQETYVPDDNFEAFLEANGMGNGIANDDYVTTANISGVTSLNIAIKQIADLTGIEDFTALETLDFTFNGVGSFDASSNTNLRVLSCAFNGMSSLNVSGNTNLETLTCSTNGISTLDLSTNIKLKSLNAASNGLTSINLGSIDALETVNVLGNNLSTIDLSNLSNLTDLNCANNSDLDIADFSGATSLVNLNCDSTDLTSLDLSDNVLLETLTIDFLSGLDVDLSNNTALTSFSGQTSLTSLNIKNGNNANITSFDARGGDMSCIQVDDVDAAYLSTWQKDNTTSFEKDCSQTSIPDIDFEYYLETHDANGNVVSIGSPNSMGNGLEDDGYVITSRIVDVTTLDISGNSIGELDGLEAFESLEILDCSENNFNEFDFSQLPELKELYLHDVFFAVLDVSSNLKLEKLIYNDANSTTLILGDNDVITELNIGGNDISALDISSYTTIAILNIEGNNQLSSINDHIPLLTNLKNLNAKGVYLSNTDFSKNLLLETLVIDEAAGFYLDLSANTALTSLSAYDANLTGINIQNGNNANITYFNAEDNSTMKCVQVDDPDASYLNSWDVDSNIIFSLDCRETNVPDDNFENYLETHNASGGTVSVGDATSMGNGIANDNKVYTSGIASVENLSISRLNISDITGIEAFTALKAFTCSNNNIITLNVSQNTELTSLLCSRNQITNLDLSQNIKLDKLSCFNNPLGSLDVTMLTLLEDLDCVESQLTSIDLSQNPELKYLQIYDNSLASLDISNNLKLVEFYAEGNSIESLDLSKHTLLEDVSLAYNQLTYLNLRNGNNTNFDNSDFDITNNPNLTCVVVDDISYANTNFTDKDVQTLYNTFCSTTYVPDDNFENYLETHTSMGQVVPVGDPASMGNGIANDDLVGTEKVQVLRNLSVEGRGITDFTGLEAFIGLEIFRGSRNTISNPDLSLTANVNLKEIDCQDMGLTSVNLSRLISLEIIRARNNNLSTIDVSSSTALHTLNLDQNNFSSIDLSVNTGLIDFRIRENSVSTLDISNNTNLTQLYIDDNSIATLNVANNSLLETLSCGGNEFVTIDLSMLANLDDLAIGDTPTLTFLDVSSNLNLEDIFVDNNTLLTTLDLSNHTKLDEVYTNNTAIVALDFSNSPDIEYVECQNGQLTSLNFKNGNNNSGMEVYATGNPNLSCITVDDPNASYLSSNWEKDATTSFGEYCRLTYVPDDEFEAFLESQGYGNGIDNDDYVYTALVEVSEGIIFQNKMVTDMTGIEDFRDMWYLICRNNNNLTSINLSNNSKLSVITLANNNLTSLDLTNNTLLEQVYLEDNANLGDVDISTLTALTNLSVSNTGINSIDISNNPLLRQLILNDNNFTNLDLSPYPSIIQLRIANNQLTSLNVANGNNDNFTWFDALGNPDLTCIKADKVVQLYPDIWQKDDTASFALYCDLTYIADANFENYLETHDADGNIVAVGDAISMGNGIANDNQVATEKIETVVNLDLNRLNIADLTGIEAFAALESLNIDYNDLTTLDVSSNLNLKVLDAAENDLTSLNFTGHPALEEIVLRSNFITSVLVDNNPTLKVLSVYKNPITSLNVSSCVRLEDLVVSETLLEFLNVKNGNNSIITNFEGSYNPNLYCILVDNPSAAYLVDWDKDDTAVFNEDCTAPVITLTGDNPQEIELGAGYTELGASTDDGGDVVINSSDYIDAVGSYTISYNATDAFGNAATEVSRTVNVVDTTAPVISLLGANPQEIEFGDGYTELGATTDDGTSVVIHSSDFVDAVGQYTITYNATDASGNMAIEVIRTVNVVDTTAPVITLTGANPQEIELGSGYIELGATTDDGSMVSIDSSDFVDAVGQYTITYNATNASGNMAIEVIRTVNVVDTKAPVITLTGANPQEIELGSEYTELGATTDDGSMVSIDSSDFVDAVGQYTIIYNATDASGNMAIEVTRTVNVVDTDLPDVVCQNITVLLDETGNVSITADQVDNGSNDISGIASLSLDITSFDCSTTGNNMVVLTAIDNNGNSNSCNAIITVVDEIVPVFDPSTIPNNIEVGFDSGGQYSLANFISNVIVSDNCTGLNTNIVQDPAPGTLLGIGDHLITVYAEDTSSNVSTTTFTVSVIATLGTEENQQTNFELYPNPAKDYFQISGLLDQTEVSIYTINGIEVNRAIIDSSGLIDIQDLSNGVYLIRIEKKNTHQIIKLIKNE